MYFQTISFHPFKFTRFIIYSFVFMFCFSYDVICYEIIFIIHEIYYLFSSFEHLLIPVFFLCSISEGDPHNYLTYFKRGTVYLALGKAKFALLDFDKVLELKPDFHSVKFTIFHLHRHLLLLLGFKIISTVPGMFQKNIIF